MDELQVEAIEYAFSRVKRRLARDFGVEGLEVERIGEGELDPMGEWRGSALICEAVFLIGWHGKALKVSAISSNGLEFLEGEQLRDYLDC